MEGNTELQSSSGNNLLPGGNQDFDFNWTPAREGIYVLHAEVVYALDEFLDNNIFNVFRFNAYLPQTQNQLRPSNFNQSNAGTQDNPYLINISCPSVLIPMAKTVQVFGQ